jgi:hypothetical protein
MSDQPTEGIKNNKEYFLLENKFPKRVYIKDSIKVKGIPR